MTLSPDALAGKRVSVLGFGRREGVALVRYLVAAGARVLVSDRQPAAQLSASLEGIAGLPVNLDLGGHDEARILAESDLICVSPVIPRTLPLLREAARRGIALSSEGELFFERCPAPILGVTGSAGKTTTTTLLGKMLAAAGRRVFVGGNIGRPLLNDLSAILPDSAVLMELSSFQLQPMTRSPHGAVVTNLTPNHLDRHADMAEYAAAKRQIVAHQQPGDWAVLNAADSAVAAFAAATPATIAWFSLEEPAREGDAAFGRDGALMLRRTGETRAVLPLNRLQLRGRHNQENALAAALAASLAGVPDAVIAEVLASFGGVEHRLERIGGINGAAYYDDSIASTPERLLAALRSFDRGEPLVVILGGRDKHLPWGEAATLLRERAHTVVLYGEACGLIRAALAAAAGARATPTVREHAAFDDAVQAAIAAARPGDAVLLSPGCTSFDQFVDFAARGQRFAALVRGAPGFQA